MKTAIVVKGLRFVRYDGISKDFFYIIFDTAIVFFIVALNI